MRGVRWALFILLVVGAGSEARGQVAQEESLLVSTATRPALDISSPLPEPADFLSDGVPRDFGAEWTSSWELGARKGRDVRQAIYDELMEARLVVDSTAAREAVDAVDEAVSRVQAVTDRLPLHLSLSFSESERLLVGAKAQEADGHWSEAAILALRAGDALRELMPKTVALTLIDAAEAALTSLPVSGEVRTAEDVERARRLILWARSAVEGGNHRRAIQRSYYACRLLGVILP